MEIRFLGHSCIHITHEGHRLIIDPFLTGNPVAAAKPEEVKADYILLTHGHNDHVGDALELARANNATIIAPNELAVYFSWQGAKVHAMHIGGSFAFPFGRVKLTQAFHGSAYQPPGKQELLYMGMPAGFLLMLGGKTLYHAGDTALFGDMKLIGDRHAIDLAFLPIGDNFTMGPEDALYAAQLLNAREVVPIHYNTFPLIEQDGEAFVSRLQAAGIRGRVLEPGESMSL